MFFKKAQAALEFLTTYGWAFTLILSMVGGLSYFGILDPGSFVGDRCIVGSPFSCDQFVVGSDGFLVSLRHGLSDRLIVSEFFYFDENGNRVFCNGFSEVEFGPNSEVVIGCGFNDSNSIESRFGFGFKYRSISDSSGDFSRLISGDLRVSRPEENNVLSASIPSNNPPGDPSAILQGMSGSGTAIDPYIITNDLELQSMSANLTAYYRLGNNINLAGTVNWNGGLGFQPISGFMGDFDGAGFIISNLYINRPSSDYVGLFGFSLANLTNLNLNNVQISGKSYVGSISGYHYGGSVTNSQAIGTISASGEYLGGLFGMLYNSNVNNSRSYLQVTQTGGFSNTGGFTGYMWGNSLLENSISEGGVSGTAYVGGFVGTLYGSNSIIRNSYASGIVNATSGPVGGFVGIVSESKVENSYSLGDVSGAPNIGGFAGEVQHAGSISNSFSRGSVTRISSSITRVAGFAGNNFRATIINSYSTGPVYYANGVDPINKGFLGGRNTAGSYLESGNYFDSQTSLQSSTIGNAIALNTSQMIGSNAQINMPSLNFTSIWSTSSSYPLLNLSN